MARFAIRRLGSMALVLFAVSVLTFLIFNVIPNNDPAERMAGRTTTQTEIEAIRKEWKFDEPVYEQYLTTMEKIFTGDLISYTTRLNVVEEIGKGIPRTFSLAIGAAIIWMAFGVALGLFSAVRAGGISDRLLTALALIGISMPVFWIGALMNHYLGFEAGIFPNGGYVELTEDPIDWFYHLIMPWLALAILYIGIYSRVLRSNILDTVNEDYVRTARAKGLSERRVLVGHVLRNSLIPITTLMAFDFAGVVGGAIITENVFGWQGMGTLFTKGLREVDPAPVMAFFLVSGAAIVTFNMLADIAYAYLDPRIRLS